MWKYENESNEWLLIWLYCFAFWNNFITYHLFRPCCCLFNINHFVNESNLLIILKFLFFLLITFTLFQLLSILTMLFFCIILFVFLSLILYKHFDIRLKINVILNFADTKICVFYLLIMKFYFIYFLFLLCYNLQNILT